MDTDFCDLGHQAIAFLGTCPLCRLKEREGHGVVRPLVEGRLTLRRDLDRALQAHYLHALTDRDLDRLAGWQDPDRL